MILYTTLGSSDLERSTVFYDAVMATLEISRAPDWDENFRGWGKSYDDGISLWISSPFDSKPPTPGNGAMIAFKAVSAEMVQAFYAAALRHGGADEGPPGVRPHYSPHFYAAYVRDPDGNKLAAVFHRYERE
jgi:catechol 2,3-dioxygenase-like lactoylglutathione lyase family enzyme